MNTVHAPSTSSLLSFQGGLIRSELLGNEGLPWLVMCHGLGLNVKDLRPIAESLAKEWRVLLWDMPGHGASQPAPHDYHAAEMAQTLEFLISANGVTKPVLFGFSFGGVVAQYFIRQNPGAARGFVAYACFAPFSQPRVSPCFLVRLSVASLRVQRWDNICDKFSRQCAVTLIAQQHVRGEVEQLNKGEFARMAIAVHTAFDPDPLFRLDLPVLLIRGSLDSGKLALAQSEMALTRIAPNIARVTVQGAGHCAHLDQPDRFLAAVRPFLSRLMQTS